MTTRTTRRACAVVGGAIAAGGLAYGLTTATSAGASAPNPSGSGSGSSTPSGAPAAPRPGTGRGGPGAGTDGTVTSVSGSSLTVRTPTGSTRTFSMTGSTTVRSDLTTHATRSSIDSGDHVHVLTAGTSSKRATEVDLHAAHIGGVVDSVTGSTLTVTDPDGFHRTVNLSGNTSYRRDGRTSSRSALTAGKPVNALGTVDSDGTSLGAVRVDVDPPAPPHPAPPNGHVAPPKGSHPAPPKGGRPALPSGSSAPSAHPSQGSGSAS